MNVRELQEALSKFDPELDVFCLSEDEQLLKQGRFFVVFDIVHLQETSGGFVRLSDGTPYIELGKEHGLKSIVTLNVTTDF